MAEGHHQFASYDEDITIDAPELGSTSMETSDAGLGCIAMVVTATLGPSRSSCPCCTT